MDAARGERRLVREVTVADVPAERADGVRDPGHEDAARRQRRGHVIERPENLGLGEVLQQVGGRDRRVMSRTCGEDGAEVPLPDPGHARGAGERRLFRADVYALRVEAVYLQQPDELAAAAAKVDDGAGRGRWQQRTDITPVDKSSRLVAVAVGVLSGVRLVETAPQIGQAHRSHN